MGDEERAASEASDEAPRRPTMTVTRARRLARLERCARLEALLRETDGNVAEMARRLGKDRSTVRYHLARCGLLDD